MDVGKLEVLGELTELYIPASNFIVLPVVAALSHRPSFQPDATEVDTIIETNLQEIKNNRNQQGKPLTVHNIKVMAPFFDIQGHMVWGATAMIISEFMAIAQVD